MQSQFRFERWSLAFRSAAAIAMIAVLTQPALGNPLVVETPPLTPAEQQTKFRLPPGFEIQLVASEPDVHKPMNLAFDAAGRLWVTHSLEYPFAAKDADQARDAISIFSNFEATGKAAKVERFAEQLNIPIGVLPLNNHTALAWSIPHIYRLQDTTGDGIADAKSPAFGPFGFADTHGNQNAFKLWIDGWVYANHGFANTSNVKQSGVGPTLLTMQSGNTYRFKPDGSRIEQFTWGQVNPFGSCFDPLGNLFTADCHSRPVTMLLRGGYYQSFGKPHDGVGYAPEATTIDHGGTGIAGVVYSTSPQFPAAYRDVLFVGNVITNRVHCDWLTWQGSTPLVEKVEDFLTCDDEWFRPVDIQQGPDGALYIADFYNCIIGHYEVPLSHPKRDRERGRIWRVVYTGKAADSNPTPPQSLPNLTGQSVPQLLEQLHSGNLTLRTLATQQLASLPAAEVLPPLRKLLAATDNTATKPGPAQAHALWLVERVAGLSPHEVKALATHPHELVRVHLMRALAERDDCADESLALVQTAVGQDSSPTVRRVAADALGQHPHAANVPPLLNALEHADRADVAAIHTLRVALRNQFRKDDVAAAWQEVKLPDHQRPQLVEFAALSGNATAANAACEAILANHVDFAAVAPFVPLLLRHAPADRVDPFLERIETTYRQQPEQTRRLLAEIAINRREANQAESARLRQRLSALLRERFQSEQVAAEAVIEIAKLVGQLKLQELADVLQRYATDASAAPPPRLACCEALLDVGPTAAVAPLAQLLSAADLPDHQRQRAAQLLGRIDQPEAHAALVAGLRGSSLHLAKSIAVALAPRAQSAEALLTEVAEGHASARLLTDPEVLNRLRLAKVPDLDARLQKLTADLPPTDDRITQLIAQRKAGYLAAQPSVQRGQQVFAKGVCANCHRLGDIGKNLGPGLDGIGVRGLDRLLEDILDPSRNVDQSFRTVLIATEDGQAISGFGAREEGDLLILHDNQGQPRQLATGDIVERQVLTLSPMPAGTIERIPEADFYDLLAFLLSQRTLTKRDAR